jgi:hypothetical protein
MYSHKEQRRYHLLRHGYRHYRQHVEEQRHRHERSVKSVDPEAQKRIRIGMSLFVLGVIVAAGIALVILAYGPVNAARNDLTQAKTLITQDLDNKTLLTTASGRNELAYDVESVSRDAAEANQSLTGSEPLRLLGYLPVLGTQRNGIIQLSSDLETATNVATAMLNQLTTLTDESHGTTVNLPALAGLQFLVVDGHKDLSTLNRPTSGLLGPIATARSDFDREDAKLIRLLSLSAKTIAFARPFLGLNGPQTYLIGGMNNAEMRDSGAVLSLDLLTATNGTFSIAHDASYGYYALSSPAPVTLPAGTEKIFGAYQPTLNWPNTDATADFALTGQSMQAMWQQATGQRVDGVIGLDVPGVISILRLTGPVAVPGVSGLVSASNAAYLLEDKEYQGLTTSDPQSSRRDMIAAVVKAAVDRMKLEHVDLDSFANTLSADVQGRHLMVWSDVPTDESSLQRLDAAGTLTAQGASRTIHLAVENSTADKLDYFIRVHVDLHITVDANGNALINSTVTVDNDAERNPPAGLQYGPDGINSFTPGQYVARIFFWGPKGAYVPGSTPESGLELTQTHFSLLPQQHSTASFTSVISHAIVKGHLDLHLIPQPRLTPDQLSVQLTAPAWAVSGRTRISTSWARVENFNWGFSR